MPLEASTEKGGVTPTHYYFPLRRVVVPAPKLDKKTFERPMKSYIVKETHIDTDKQAHRHNRRI